MPYRLWAQQGHLLTFPGRTTDPKAVAQKVAELHGRYQIRALAYDRWRIEDLKRELDAIGCAVPLVAHGQGYKDLSPAVDVLPLVALAMALGVASRPAPVIDIYALIG